MKKTIIFLSLTVLYSLGQLFAQQDEIFMLNLQSPTYPTNFNMIGNGYWDQTYNDSDFTFFKSQIYSFSHLIEGEGSSYSGWVWNGFTVCNSGDSTNHNPNGIWVPDYEWGCMAGGGIKTDAQGNIMFDNQGDVITELGIEYLVGFWNNLIEPEYWFLGYHPFLDEPTHCLQIILDEEEEYEAVGVYVCNHPYSYYAAKYGFASARKLDQPGDYFKLIIHGLNPDGSESGKSVEHFLAKFEDNQLHQSRKWEWIDLSSLGEVGGFYCTLKSTDEDNWGPKTPVYFCMDKWQVKIKGTILPHIPVTNIINLPDSAKVGVPLTLSGTVIPSNATCQTIEWSIKTDGGTNSSLDVNIFTALNPGTVTVTATIKDGLAENEDYVQDFNIKIIKEEIGIEENRLDKILIYSYKNTIYVKNAEMQSMEALPKIEVFDIMGRMVYQGTETVITLQVPTGVYNVRLILQDRDTTESVSTKVLILN